MMKKRFCLILALMLCLSAATAMPALAGEKPATPTIEYTGPDVFLDIKNDPVPVFVYATTTDAGTLQYQWYQTDVYDISTLQMIDGATEDEYFIQRTIGVTYYCCAVWSVLNGEKSETVYSRLIRVEITGTEPLQPTIEYTSPDVYQIVGSDPISVFVHATSPDGGTLEYLWYRTTVNDISTIKAIGGATSEEYQIPQTEGITYYCCGVWNVLNGQKSKPVYSRLIPVEYVVPQEGVISVEILQAPDKVEYIAGETLNLKGLLVRLWSQTDYVDKADGEGVIVTKDPLKTVGEQKIKVGCEGTDAFGVFIVTVKEAPHTHAFGEWEVVKEPTCTEDGLKRRTCACGESEEASIPATGHTWDSGNVTKEPSADKAGERTYTCTVCKTTQIEVIPATGSSSTSSSEASSNEVSKDPSEASSGETSKESSGETSEESSGETSKGSSIEASGGSSAETSAETTSARPGASWWLILILLAVTVIAAVTVILVITKKKKQGTTNDKR